MTEPQRDPLDSWLDSAQDVEPSAPLRRAITEVPLRHPRAAERHALWPFGGWWKVVSMALVVCALGVVAGVSSVNVIDDDPTIESDDTDLAFAIGLDEELAP